MFSKKPHSDIKKSSLKVLDVRKDSLSRLKHLRIVLDNCEVSEAKTFFESNYSHIYYVFYDVFISVENSLKQRAHRAHREELDAVRFIFEKILTLLPELLSKRWQYHSIQRIIKKFLHPGNSFKLRKEGVQLFLLWYQILGDNASEELDSIFSTLVPGINPSYPNPYLTGQGQGSRSYRDQNVPMDIYQETSTFYASSTQDDAGPVCPSEITAILPPQSGEVQVDDTTLEFLECLMESIWSQKMIQLRLLWMDEMDERSNIKNRIEELTNYNSTPVAKMTKIEWKDKSDARLQRCFQFLFEKFKKFYLPHVFPHFSWSTSLYNPLLDLPELRFDHHAETVDLTRFPSKDTLLLCQSTVVRWFTHFAQYPTYPPSEPVESAERSVSRISRDSGSDRRPTGVNESESTTQPSLSPLSTTAPYVKKPEYKLNTQNERLFQNHVIVRDTLYSSRENINLVHEVFRQAFLMPFTQSFTMKKVVSVYKDWISKNVSDKPSFLEEPSADTDCSLKEDLQKITDNYLHNVNMLLPEEIETVVQEPIGMRLRKDSYLRAIHSDHNHLRAGLQNMLQVFITNAANVFLLEVAPDKILHLEEQVEMCKRVLNIYRYMVMNIQMERKTWEQLLVILLQITSLVVKEIPPDRKEKTLGGRLAPALFQTLIVTWIKANLNVVISTELWDQFLHVLSSLTLWEELIKEWDKTVGTLTRVLAKQVYGLDMNDLPLQRLSEQKQKKQRGMRKIPSGPGSKKLDNADCSKRDRISASPGDKSRDSHDTTGQTEDEGSLPGRGNSSHVVRTRSDSGDTSRKQCISPGERMYSIHRSASDSHLCKKGQCIHITRELTSIPHGQRHAFVVTGPSPSVDDELSKILAATEEFSHEHIQPSKLYSRQRSKSLDLLSHRAESPCFSESSECRSRSPSPTPSSGLENTSIKDSPMQIDVLVSSTDNSCNNSEIGSSGVEPRSVMSGGTTRGWLPDVAVVLWRRMLGSLGDINLIKDPLIHAQVLKYLINFSEELIKIRENLGVSLDNQSSPPPPELRPPLHLITPWLFQAISLPEKYEGKILAYKLLCILTVCRHDIPLSTDYLTLFYKALHYGLVSTNQEIINTIVKHCGPRFFAVGLPGCTLLLLDFVFAAETIISSNCLTETPRTEAVSILGALVCFPNAYQDMPVLQPTSTELTSMIFKDVKDHIISMLLKASKREPTALARCIAVSSLGIYLYEELMHKTNHSRIREAVNALLLALTFNSHSVALVASDMLLLLCDHVKHLLKDHPDILRRIVEVIASKLSSLLPSPEQTPSDDDKRIILSLMICLGEWCMHVPQEVLIQHWGDNESPLLMVFKVLNAAVTGKSDLTTPKYMLDLSGPDVDPNIHVDNLQEGTNLAPSSSPKLQSSGSPDKSNFIFNSESSFFRPSAYLDPKHNTTVIQLAARNVMTHLVNHIGHFPMGIGAARLTSLVNEHDDVPTLTGDELSAEVFHAPNIQFFVLNNSSIISFVEIPALEVPGGGPTAGLTTAKSQVRMIIRDLSGKFSWDCSLLYGLPDCKGSVLSGLSSKHSLQSCKQSSALSSPTSCLSGIGNSFPNVMRHRPHDILPTVENSSDDLDNLDDLLQYIGHTSPECIFQPGQPLNSPPLLQSEGSTDKEVDTMNVVLNQRNSEQSHLQKHSGDSNMEAKPVCPPSPCEPLSAFQHCRLLLNQLGFVSWEKRPHFDLLKKNEKLLRELRNLDNQKCRETHKIAVIYAAEGQEDKNSLLLNTGGSRDFEDFVAGLGWEVELESHTGFMGGLQRNRSTGGTAPYYATSFMEVIFHVSTRMPTSNEDEAITKKLRHLGNDEVHIVWSEHKRDYRRGIIATEFGDVLIIIYPIGNCLYRINISRKPEVPHFGPLFDGAIVDHKVLPGLVRATAVNASRAKRSLIPLYQNFYEERARSLETIVQNHKDLTTFEQFAASVYSPASPKSLHASRVPGSMVHTESSSQRGTSNLAAALLDSHSQSSGYSPSLRSRPVSLSTTESVSPHSSPQSSYRSQKERPLSASHSHTSSALSHH